jgi:hypothetical protein
VPIGDKLPDPGRPFTTAEAGAGGDQPRQGIFYDPRDAQKRVCRKPAVYELGLSLVPKAELLNNAPRRRSVGTLRRTW